VIPSNWHDWLNPARWSPIIWIWLAFAVIGFLPRVWRRWQRRQAESWQVVTAQTEPGTVEPPATFRLGRNPKAYLAQINYSYSVAGQHYTGRYEREMGTNEEALDFLRDLENRATTVHYNSQDPEKSCLDEQAVEQLLQERSPIPESETYVAKAGDRIPAWLAPFLGIFLGLAAIGFLLSLWVHIEAVLGHQPIPANLFWVLHVGIFVVFIPAIFVTARRIGSTSRKDFWKAALRGTPDWIRYLVYACLAYAVVNFLLVFGPDFLSNSGKGNGNPPDQWRGFSGHWMAFYSAAFAMLYAALATRRSRLPQSQLL